MARAGTVSRVDIERARKALQARGINPSLDSIRIELGNTGSKSTIHRYLKEIEAFEIGRLNNEDFLSASIKDLIGRLVVQLQEDALAVVSDAKTEFEARQTVLLADLEKLEQQNAALATQNNQLTQSLSAEKSDHSATKELFQSAQLRAERLDQHSKDLKEQLENVQQHNASLEEKHKNARDALEHFRNATKEQREQEARRHESQVQHLQAEQRITNQTLVVKQTEITQLNRDNAQFLTEQSSLRKHQRMQEQALQEKIVALNNLETKLNQLNIEIANLIILEPQLITAKTDCEQYAQRIRELENKLLTIETELAIKNDVIDLLRHSLATHPPANIPQS